MYLKGKFVLFTVFFTLLKIRWLHHFLLAPASTMPHSKFLQNNSLPLTEPVAREKLCQGGGMGFVLSPYFLILRSGLGMSHVWRAASALLLTSDPVTTSFLVPWAL